MYLDAKDVAVLPIHFLLSMTIKNNTRVIYVNLLDRFPKVNMTQILAN